MAQEAVTSRSTGSQIPLDGASGNNCLENNLTSKDGLFTESDGSVSREIRQWDRFGQPYVDLFLLRKQKFVKGPNDRQTFEQRDNFTT
jgi:hypothetical protein